MLFKIGKGYRRIWRKTGDSKKGKTTLSDRRKGVVTNMSKSNRRLVGILAGILLMSVALVGCQSKKDNDMDNKDRTTTSHSSRTSTTTENDMSRSTQSSNLMDDISKGASDAINGISTGISDAMNHLSTSPTK